MLPFSLEQLSDAVHEGRVTARVHPSLPLTIYNYSPTVQYDNRWDDVTLNCRGLILDFEGNIVARPWKKFFNLGQVNLPIQFDDPVEVMDKVDGSLGIMYPHISPVVGSTDSYVSGYSIATRGSFMSEQAIHATEILNAKYSDVLDNASSYSLNHYTFLFEIVYPENRIVLNYDGMDDLVLLGAVHKDGGYYIGPITAQAHLGWTGPVVEVFPYKSISEALGHTDRKNAEGFVIRSHNFMVKLKQPDYVELHRLVTNITPKTVWEQLRSGKSIAQICSVLPDEFHDYAASIANPLVERYQGRLDEIIAGYSKALGVFLNAETLPSRKDFAQEFKKSQDARYFFLILDGKGIGELLWNELKPREEAHV